MSLSVPVSINPKPLSVSRLIVPSAIVFSIPKKGPAVSPEKHRVPAAPPQTQYSIGWIGYHQESHSTQFSNLAIRPAFVSGTEISNDKRLASQVCIYPGEQLPEP